MDLITGILIGLCVALSCTAVYFIYDTIKVYNELKKYKNSKK